MSERIPPPNSLMYNCGLTHFLCHFLELSYPALTLFIAADLGIPLAEAIAIGLPLYLLLGICAVPWGVISDRVGNFYCQALACFITGIGSIGLSLSSNTNSMFWSLTAVGIGVAAFHPAGMGAISSNYIERRGRALAVHGAWGGLGIIAAPLVAGLIAYAISWRSFYVLSGVFAFLVGVWSYSIYIKWEKTSSARVEKDKARSKKIGNYLGDLLKIFKFREFFLLVCCMTIAGFVYRANSIALPLRLKEAAGPLLTGLASFIENLSLTSPGSAADPLDASTALLYSLAFCGGILGQFKAGALADKSNLAKTYFVFFFLAIPCLIAMGLASGAPLIIFSMAYVFFGLGMQPIENSLVAKLSPPEILSSVYGLKFLFTFGVGALAVFPTSYFTDRSLVTGLYLLLAGTLLIHVFLVSRMKLFKEKEQT